MSRRALVAALLLVTVTGLVACGRYGPPHRRGGSTDTDAGASGPQGTGILDPSSDPLPPPEAPPEEPEEEPAP